MKTGFWFEGFVTRIDYFFVPSYDCIWRRPLCVQRRLSTEPEILRGHWNDLKGNLTWRQVLQGGLDVSEGGSEFQLGRSTRLQKQPERVDGGVKESVCEWNYLKNVRIRIELQTKSLLDLVEGVYAKVDVESNHKDLTLWRDIKY